MQSYTVTSPDAMIQLGTMLSTLWSKFMINGWLWAWKTHLCKWYAESLGISNSQVHSPTYTYYHEYDHTLFHWDFYRIQDPATLITRGIIDIIEEYEYCFIERPNFSEYYADSSRHTITIEQDPADENSRLVTIQHYH